MYILCLTGLTIMVSLRHIKRATPKDRPSLRVDFDYFLGWMPHLVAEWRKKTLRISALEIVSTDVAMVVVLRLLASKVATQASAVRA